MNLIIEQLHHDHKQLVRILYHLERELKAFNGLLKEAANMETILDILDYIQVYPEIWHHPTEDVIYEMLLQKDIPSPELLADALEEHAILELLTENLQANINAAVTDQDFSPARFIKSTTVFINRQLQHMEREQKNLFPLAEKYLDKSDWDVIKQRLKSQQQLRQESRLQQYESLYQDIANSNAVTAR